MPNFIRISTGFFNLDFVREVQIFEFQGRLRSSITTYDGAMKDLSVGETERLIGALEDHLVTVGQPTAANPLEG